MTDQATIGGEIATGLNPTSLVKADQLDGMVRGFLSPMLTSTDAAEKAKEEV